MPVVSRTVCLNFVGSFRLLGRWVKITLAIFGERRSKGERCGLETLFRTLRTESGIAREA
jgi:hypothetical protein